MSDVAHLYRVVQDQRTGKMLTGVSVALCEPGSQTPISTQVYSDEALTLPLANPFVATQGIIDVYLPAPRNVALKTTYGASVTVADNIQVLPHAEYLLATPVPVTITNGPGTNTLLIGDDASTAHFASPEELFVDPVTTLIGWAYAGAYALNAATRNEDGALTDADVSWPDGSYGHYTADVINADRPSKVDAYSLSYGDPATYTIVQAEVTRDDQGNVIAQPSLVANIAE